MTGLGERLQHLVEAPGFAPVALLVAFAAGAAHAVGPGHGKSLAAAYIVGTQGKVRDALWMGGSVAAMHTCSVLVIAVAWTFFSLSGLVELKTLTTSLQLVSGLLVLGTGLWLLRRWRRTGGHGHGHSHGHGHGHHDQALSRPGLVLLGISGGLVPSPSAFLVLVTGLFTGRAALALLLVVVFGLGMAVVLVGVGLLALAGSTALVRGGESVAALRLASRAAPALAAGGITLLGGAITALAVVGLTTA
ncbi:MAG TPA: cobalt transporter [Nocardioides sp.]|uniref:HoxN/HupN/NixA family nickel/cobalt transporter n=1 Tax=Nocardioides sp. TaxID=35761 RepID=UPI002C7A83D8|nr:cobalt transporter [Nocardioides sp.]HTW15580.1 cobalt transporter [Nocardioides sp.]